MNSSDEKLVADYLAGDEKSLEVLIKRYLKPIYSFTFRFVENSQEAEDITQEVFVKVWRNLKKPVPYRIYSGAGFDPKKGKFKTWIFSIAKNTCLDFLKKKRAIPFSEFENDEGENKITETLADFSPLPQEILEKAETAQTLQVALEKLSPKYRMVLFLRYNDHFTFREISEILEESINTIKSRHRRGIIFLKKLLT